MGTYNSLGITLSIVFTFLFLALIAELYYLLWWKNRTTTATKQLFALFCFFKKQPPSSLASTPSDILNSVRITDKSDSSLFKREDSIEEGIEAKLIRLHNLPSFPRLLFTIQEEMKEEMESDDDKSRYGRSRKGSRGKSLSEFSSPVTPHSLHDLGEICRRPQSREYLHRNCPPPPPRNSEQIQSQKIQETAAGEKDVLGRMKINSWRENSS